MTLILVARLPSILNFIVLLLTTAPEWIYGFQRLFMRKYFKEVPYNICLKYGLEIHKPIVHCMNSRLTKKSEGRMN